LLIPSILRLVTGYPGQLGLAIPSWEGPMSTSISWEGTVVAYRPSVTDTVAVPLILNYYL